MKSTNRFDFVCVAQDDDFKYLVEPKIRWRHHCCSLYALLGLVVMIMGAVAMAAGHLIPAKNPVVLSDANTEAIDPWAIAFNDHLASCRYIGSMVLSVGVVFTVVQFWISVIRGDDQATVAAIKKLAADDRRRPSVRPDQQPQTVRIPITGSVETVQPDPRAIDMHFGNKSWKTTYILLYYRIYCTIIMHYTILLLIYRHYHYKYVDIDNTILLYPCRYCWCCCCWNNYTFYAGFVSWPQC